MNFSVDVLVHVRSCALLFSSNNFSLFLDMIFQHALFFGLLSKLVLLVEVLFSLVGLLLLEMLLVTPESSWWWISMLMGISDIISRLSATSALRASSSSSVRNWFVSELEFFQSLMHSLVFLTPLLVGFVMVACALHFFQLAL